MKNTGIRTAVDGLVAGPSRGCRSRTTAEVSLLPLMVVTATDKHLLDAEAHLPLLKLGRSLALFGEPASE